MKEKDKSAVALGKLRASKQFAGQTEAQRKERMKAVRAGIKLSDMPVGKS